MVSIQLMEEVPLKGHLFASRSFAGSSAAFAGCARGSVFRNRERFGRGGLVSPFGTVQLEDGFRFAFPYPVRHALLFKFAALHNGSLLPNCQRPAWNLFNFWFSEC
jgi:hypothetical protein